MTAQPPINGKRRKATIERVLSVNAEINLYHLKLEGQHDFSFLPGQFVMVILKDKEGKEVRRAYSIASSPLEKGHIELCVKKYQDGKLSPLLFKMKKGGQLDIEGPYGRYVLQAPLPGEIACIAAGTGIAPIMSMIRTMAASSFPVMTTLYYGFRYPHDFIYRDELLSYAQQHPTFQAIPTISTKEDIDWDGSRGYVQDIAKERISSGNLGSSIHAYLCGPPGMVESAKKMLLDIGMRKEDIFREQWE
ncbi:hypothetical protein HYU19_04915 [Candidatus Woesearchaeota archaeon]|nr:hypothetical protein [Candidatus Woesearchaeota archaeon]